jgi:hypothetical protein
MGKFTELEISIIGAQSHNWPPPDTSLQWQALHDVIAMTQQAARNADNEIMAFESDSDLSAEGKRRRVAAVAQQAIEALETNGMLARAEKAVGRWLQGLDEKIRTVLTTRTNVGDTMLAAEIRAHVASQKNQEIFLEKHKGDARVVQAVVGARAFLSGLTEESKDLFLKRAALAMSPKEVAQKEQLSKALEIARQSIAQAARKIAERGQLARTANGWATKL